MKIRNILAGMAVMAFLSMNSSAEAFGAEKKDVALQLYSVRTLMDKGAKYENDCKGLLKALGKMGYTAVEAASYNDGKFYGMEPAEYGKAVRDAGMTPLSSHTTRQLSEEELASHDFTKALEWWKKCIADHKAAGMTYIVAPWMSVPKTLKDLKTYCDYYNAVGELCARNGVSFGYHNHSHEFQKVEDQVMLDYMLQNTDPSKVFFQLDVYWAMMGKASPVDYFSKYPGRFKLLHIKDRREIGQSGMVGFDAIFRNAGKAGMKYPVVELEEATKDIESGVKESIDYLLDAPFVKASYR